MEGEKVKERARDGRWVRKGGLRAGRVGVGWGGGVWWGGGREREEKEGLRCVGGGGAGGGRGG